MIEPGSRLGPYQILAPLGAGGMGEVYRARDPRLERDVAIKVLPEHLMADADALARFEREAKALAALQHPNILAIHDVGHEGGLGYLVTELLEGSTLRERLRQGRIPPSKAAEFGAAIAHGLAAAHGRNLIHRDLKPENIFITKEGRVKILDFGLAKPPPGGLGENAATQPLAGQPLKTAEGVLLGTVGYMSPEQVQGQPLDPRSDLFSLGVVLHEMLSGERPFSGPSAIDTLHAILRNEPPDLASLATGVPPALSRIVHRCLEKEPEQRSQSARDLAFELETLSLATAERPVVGPAPGLRPRAWLVGLSALGVGLLLWWKWPVASVPQPTYTQLTYRRGTVASARFTPDGSAAVYSASWDGGPMELSQGRLDGSSPRSLGVQNAKVQSVSPSGEILVTIMRTGVAFGLAGTGILAVLSTEGGTPKEMLKEVHAADFGPDGRSIAAVYHPGEGSIRLDYPLGHPILTEPGGEFTEVRVSPDGRWIAVLRQVTPTDPCRILLVDPEGKRRDLLKEGKATAIRGLAWAPGGEALFFSRSSALWTLDLRGHERLLRREAVQESLQDVSRSGASLLVRSITQASTFVRREGQERDLSISPRTRMNGLSADGRQVLLNDLGGEGALSGTRSVLRGTDGSPPRFLGQGRALELHPQAQWTIVSQGVESRSVSLIPTGPGLPREVGQKGFSITGAFFSATGGSLMVFAIPDGGTQGLYRTPLDGGPWTALPISTDGMTLCMASDDSALLAQDAQDRPVLRPLDGGAERVIGPSLKAGEGIYAWDGADRLVVGPQQMRDPLQLDLVDLKTGHRSPWQQIALRDAPGGSRLWGALVSRDLSTLVYSVDREIASDLFVAEGLK